MYKNSYNLPNAYKAYAEQRGNAKKRNIAFDITFEDWCKIWYESGKWEERGRGRGRYVMARNEDYGGYSVDNVSIKTQEENGREGVHMGERNYAKRPEARAKISAALTGHKKPKFECKHCGHMIAGMSNLLRWHNENCKKRSS